MIFANDAVSEYAGVSQISAGTLERLRNRVTGLTRDIREIGHKLEQHADKVHGEPPKQGEANKAYPVRSGLIGALEDALDELAEAHSFVAEQAGRNCTLA